MKKLKELTWHEYNTLKNMGFLWELYPEAPNTYSEIFKEGENKVCECRGIVSDIHSGGMPLGYVACSQEKIEELPEVKNSIRNLMGRIRPDEILIYDKINEIIKKLNGE